MSDRWILTEEELDAMLEQPPVYDPERVKQCTLSRISGEEEPQKRPFRWRGALIAAIICALSVTIAAADYSTGGRVARVLGLRREPPDPPAQEEPLPEEPVEEAPPAPPPAPEPKPEQPPLPQLDADIAQELQVQGQQLPVLRPAAQNVGQTAEQGDVRMTVLQTLGDPACLYVKLRFDFPESVPVSQELEFESLRVELDGSNSLSTTHRVLERTEHSCTCLMELSTSGSSPLPGQTITLTARNYGRPKDVPGNSIQMSLKAGAVRQVMLDPDGNINAEVTPDDLGLLTAEMVREDTSQPGFSVRYYADGYVLITYDGTQGKAYLTVFRGETPEIVVGGNPRFETVLEGEWRLTWKLDYQDASRSWTGSESVIDPTLFVTQVRVSPLSWDATFVGDEFAPLFLSDVLGGWTAQLRHADGTFTDLKHTGSGMDVSQDKTVYTITSGGRFDTAIDLSTVAAVVIDGVDFPLQ